MGKQLIIKGADFSTNALYKDKLIVTTNYRLGTPLTTTTAPYNIWFPIKEGLSPYVGKTVVGVQLYRSNTTTLPDTTPIVVTKLVCNEDLTINGLTNKSNVTEKTTLVSIPATNYVELSPMDPIQIMLPTPITFTTNIVVGVNSHAINYYFLNVWTENGTQSISASGNLGGINKNVIFDLIYIDDSE